MPAKTKDMLTTLKAVFGSAFSLVLKKKQVRSGKGKRRGRKYKSNAGLLIVTGKEEKVKVSGLDVKPFNKIRIADVYPLGRLTLYTQKALEEMSK